MSDTDSVTSGNTTADEDDNEDDNKVNDEAKVIDSDSSTYLLKIACITENIALIKLLLYNDNTHNIYHSLNLACCIGNIEIVQLLLDYYIRANCKTDSGIANFVTLVDVSLMYACRYGHIDIIKLLLHYSSKKDKVFLHAYAHACLAGNINVFTLLYSYYKPDFNRCFTYSCIYSNIDIAQHILWTTPHKQCINLGNAIKISAKHGQLKMIKWIIEDVYNKNRNIYTNPLNLNGGLTMACRYGYYDVAAYLIQCGVTDVNKYMVKISRYNDNDCSYNKIMNLLVLHGGNSFYECLTAVCKNGKYNKLSYLLTIHTFTVDELNEALSIVHKTILDGVEFIMLLIHYGATNHHIILKGCTLRYLNMGCHQINNEHSKVMKINRNDTIVEAMSIFDDVINVQDWDHNIMDKLIAEYYVMYKLEV